MEAEALATKVRLEFTIDAARLGTWDWNIQTGTIVFNERWAVMLGYCLDELEPKVSTLEKTPSPGRGSRGHETDQ
ncbi:MAG: PAS domain-containing protein [Desulfoarculaceae bacterium]|nr:PAS domain-containing protein [Desulfoarculaceae bacterium]